MSILSRPIVPLLIICTVLTTSAAYAEHKIAKHTYEHFKQPFRNIQSQIDTLQEQINSLQEQINDLPSSGGGPVEMTVDCTTDSIMDVLNKYADTYGKLTINIKGMCNEVIQITRDRVVLRGDPNSPGPHGINAENITAPFAINISGASGISLESLTVVANPGLPRPNIGIACGGGAEAAIKNVTVSGFSGNGIFAGFNGICSVTDSDISNNNFAGVWAANSGALLIVNSQIHDNTFTGAGVYVNGSIAIIANSFTTVQGSSITNNNIGILAEGGGSVSVTGDSSNNIFVNIQNNTGPGVLLSQLGIFNPQNANITDNGGTGIQCSGSFSLAWYPGVTLNNNAGGNLSPECPPQPPFPLP